MVTPLRPFDPSSTVPAILLVTGPVGATATVVRKQEVGSALLSQEIRMLSSPFAAEHQLAPAFEASAILDQRPFWRCT